MDLEQYLKLQNEKIRKVDKSVGRRQEDMSVTREKESLFTGMELVKHLGTVLVVLIPLGNGYMNINNTLIEHNMKIQQQADKIKMLSDDIIVLQGVITDIRTTLDMNIQNESANIREIRRRLNELEKAKK